MKAILALSCSVALASCHSEQASPKAVAVVVPPRPIASAADALSPPVEPGREAPQPVLAPPVLAKFLSPTKTGTKIFVGSKCDVIFVAVAKGAIEVAGQSLAAGDIVALSASSDLEMKGTGLVVVATALHDCASGAPDSSAPLKRVVRGSDAKDLSWGGGAMHAHLDLGKDVSPDVYMGRLEGTAPVAEHEHTSSWEILCAVEGSGTFTLDGLANHVVAPAIVAVPPGRKHSWQPDPGTKLVAVQIYSPPGPEQRFVALASGGR